MTPQQIDAMKLALEALQADELDMVDDGSGNMVFRKEQAITAIEEVLAEHAMQEVQRLGQEIEQCQCPECQIKPHASDCAVHSEPAYPKGKCDCGAQPEQEPKIGCVNHDCDQCKAQTEQEPVAWMKASDTEWSISFFEEDGYIPLYTTPPQRKPLTDKAITQVIDSMPKKMKGFMVDWDLYEFARAIESAHGIKEST